MPPTKTQREAKAKRRREVEAMISMQMDSLRIQTEISAKYEVTFRTVRGDIKAIYDRWEQEAAGERKSRRTQMRQTLRRIMQRALAANDYKAAIAACDRIMKLDGLNAPLRIEQSVQTTSRIELMTSDQQRKRMWELMAKAGVPMVRPAKPKPKPPQLEAPTPKPKPEPEVPEWAKGNGHSQPN